MRSSYTRWVCGTGWFEWTEIWTEITGMTKLPLYTVANGPKIGPKFTGTPKTAVLHCGIWTEIGPKLWAYSSRCCTLDSQVPGWYRADMLSWTASFREEQRIYEDNERAFAVKTSKLLEYVQHRTERIKLCLAADCVDCIKNTEIMMRREHRHQPVDVYTTALTTLYQAKQRLYNEKFGRSATSLNESQVQVVALLAQALTTAESKLYDACGSTKNDQSMASDICLNFCNSIALCAELVYEVAPLY